MTRYNREFDVVVCNRITILYILKLEYTMENYETHGTNSASKIKAQVLSLSQFYSENAA